MIAFGDQEGGVILWDSAEMEDVTKLGDIWVYSVSWSPAKPLDKLTKICYYIE